MAKSIRERQEDFRNRQKYLGRHQRYFWVSDTEFFELKRRLKDIRERATEENV
ncbi:TPA: hypothetical protein NKU90_004628 [Vibrio parahaemolyticus]|uniref:hypothetical protein n=1 Tax=Vibrio harveyi group TaxID=717610 RepID=UPI0015877774|nr:MULTISPECIES: hypothetical protein [Vibrio harveyi group]EJA3434570.1 hypothetical protein [Vibrio parahaemolyticus]EJE4711319.1 hypothetical protein [Vibrio parahaemolyticus]EKZ9072645.1 hypothetical protein [Vibrio parahaemolyticus]MCG6238903.1 hypothetical protein [Vibrio diabolicus]MCR9718494.1 hypothetical protein [Vibrio parahaemolyticus]